MITPLLGWIPPSQRTPDQHDAHYRALSRMVRFGIAGGETADPPAGTKVLLTDLWKDAEVVADVGYEFTGFRQLTGSCVGVSAGNAVFTLAAVQRKLSSGPTKAFVPWWPFPYGRTRYNEGDRGQGEGAVDSVMAQTLVREGCFSVTEAAGLPAYDRSDGLALDSRTEYQYSDGAATVNTKWSELARTHPLGAAAVLGSPTEIRDAVLNGYPVLDGCALYVGRGSLSGDVALGNYDGQGGHSTCFLGYWNHATLGPLYLYSNQWDGSTYPQDGSGKCRCSVWLKEANVQTLFRQGGDQGETVALSHLSYFPAQPKVRELLDWKH